ncbi:hypothetical protein D6T65_12370 [Arthrobacter frigidicola]|nr:hypothetical protein D6T65_12370 [Arthrobacter frigidicola]
MRPAAGHPVAGLSVHGTFSYPRRMGDIQRAKIGTWEKTGYVFLFAAAPPFLIVSDLLEFLGFGFWARMGLTGLVCLGAGYLLSRRVAVERSRRLASDLSRGVFDCAIRYPDSHPGSLRDRWNPGVGQVIDARLLFQPQDASGDPSPTPLGAPRDLGIDNLEGVIAQEGKRPVELRRGWKVLAVDTPSGKMHLAAGDPALELLREEFAH